MMACGGVEVWRHNFLILAPDGGQFHVSAAFLLGKHHSIPTKTSDEVFKTRCCNKHFNIINRLRIIYSR